MSILNKKKYLYITGGIILIDQISKILIQSILSQYDKIKLIDGFLQIIHVHNSGAIWGLFSDNPSTIVTILITLFSIAALVVVIFFFLKLDIKCKLELFSFSLIIGGAIGNIIDRILQGYVVDFIDVYIKNWHWPTFNFSDSSITIGVILVIFSLWRDKCSQF